MERFVFVRPGALGDALLALPTLALLRRARLAAHVTLVARGDVLPLARASMLADAASDWVDPLWAALFTDDPQAHAAGAIVQDAAVVAWLADAGGALTRNLQAWGARQVVVAPGRPPEERAAPGEHTALLLAHALVPLGISVPTTAEELAAGMPPLHVDPRDAQIAAQAWGALDHDADPPARPVVALHAGSGGAAKRWPPERFAALARRLITRGFRPLLVEGPDDAEVTAAVLAALDTETDAIRVARGLSVGALAALLRRCTAYAGNDTGVSHLAALAGVPALALFGPSDPSRWAPLGPHVRILRAPEGDMARLEPGDVWEALLGILSSLRPAAPAR